MELNLTELEDDGAAILRIIPRSRTPHQLGLGDGGLDAFADSFAQATLAGVVGYRWGIYGMEVDGLRRWREIQLGTLESEQATRAPFTSSMSPPGLILNDDLARTLQVSNMLRFSVGYMWRPHVGFDDRPWRAPLQSGVRYL